MKGFITIIILFIFQNLYCQKYTFDNFYEYNTNSKSVFFMVNSTNDNYAFYGYKTPLATHSEFEYDQNDLVFSNNLLKFFAHRFFDSRDISDIANKLPIKMKFVYENRYINEANLTKKIKTNTLLTLNKVTIQYLK